MSAQPISAPTLGVPMGGSAVVERVQQLEALIAQARAAALGSVAPTSELRAQAPTSFASALQNARTEATGAGSGEGEGGSSSNYDGLIQSAAAHYGIDPAVLHGLIQQESGFDPNSQSGAGAMGLTQLMPGTASSLGVSNPMNPAESIEGGARYLAQMMSQFGGNVRDALAAYNAGPGAVSQYGGVPPYAETESYVTKVLGYAESYRQSHPATAASGAVAA
jgi:soluble lytic murein transglycosylase-like protein